VFTGIVTAVGTVREANAGDRGLTLVIEAPYRGVALGESIAVDGACLTVEAKGRGWFSVHVIRTSLDRTRFGRYGVGRKVNLERALRAGDPLGGHLVQGHVDGIGTIRRVGQRDDARIMDLSVPASVAQASIPLGSIALDGVSLTINAMPAPEVVQISLIPFTFQQTTLGLREVGDEVHVEGDVIGKYVRGLVAPWRTSLRASET
jgi:riboflavin synthase